VAQPLEAALPPVFARAEACLQECATRRLTLPEHFSDLMKRRSERLEFQRLINLFPSELAGLAHLKPDDRSDLPFDGNAEGSLATSDGRKVQIYYNVGYPEKQWVNWEAFRRPAGSLWVAVDGSSGKMAGIFAGGEDWSSYSFRGDPDLVAPLLAYVAADDIHVDQAVEAANANGEAPPLAFPLQADVLSRSADRLKYLAAHFVDGKVEGTQSTSSMTQEARDKAGLSWFAPNGSHTACIRSGGPAEKLDEFEGLMDRPTTQDYSDADGNLTKVEVSNNEKDGTVRVWSFYRSRSDCEAEWVTRTEDLANRYR
jgi:hypothetical protein